EGTFYLWTENQIREVLPTGVADQFIERFQVTKAGNFAGKSILHLTPGAQLPDDNDPLVQKLRTIREGQRTRPHRDEKILTGWNGLMIAALARLSANHEHPAALQAAQRAHDFIATNLVDGSGRLLRRFFHGEAGIPAFLEDYASLAWGCLELYLSGFTTASLRAAVHWTEQLLVLFDDGAGSFYDTATDTEVVITRNRSLQDGALPAGISIAAGVLIRLGRLTGRTDLEERGITLLEQHAGLYSRFPSAYAQALLAVDELLGPGVEATIVCGRNRNEAARMLQVLRGQELPRVLILWKGTQNAELDRLAPRQRGQMALNGLSTVYLCSGRRCLEPTTDIDQLDGHLNSLNKDDLRA
ncbi:MAG TPA: hypothetical protein VJ995_02920, partial [Geothermobacteraceae bacterium]|nr:hypothetical protein [Geothermobacteraceae bacterium]